MTALLRSTLIIVALTIIGGCGGGTRGTGGTEFTGKVLTTTGNPVEGATVSIPATGDSDLTDASGSFFFEASVAGDVDFQVQALGVSAAVTVSGIPAGASKVTVQFKVNSTAGTVDLDDVGIENDDDDSSGSDSDSDDDSNDDSDDDSDSDDDDSNDDSDDDSNDDSDDDNDDSDDDSSDDSNDDSGDDDSGNDGGSGDDDGTPDQGSGDDDGDEDEDDEDEDDHGGNSGSGGSGNSGSGSGDDD